MRPNEFDTAPTFMPTKPPRAEEFVIGTYILVTVKFRKLIDGHCLRDRGVTLEVVNIG